MKTLIEGMDVNEMLFHNEKLIRVYHCEIHQNKKSIGSVDLSKVVGTAHIDYGGKTWGELKPIKGSLAYPFDKKVVLQSLKRASDNVRKLKKKPNYYLNDEVKDEWSFYSIDGKYYIKEGNHRTIISRLFFSLNGMNQIAHGVKIIDAKFKPQKKQSLISNLLKQLKHYKLG